MATVKHLKETLKDKINLCGSAITNRSSFTSDNTQSNTIANLAKALWYLDQIKEEE